MTKISRRWVESEIAKREGKKKQVSIGNVRETISVIGDLVVESEMPPAAWAAFFAAIGAARVKRKKKKA